MTIRQQWNALLCRLGLVPDTSDTVSEDQLQILNAALAEQTQPPEPLAEEPPARAAATATKTSSQEDPSPNEPTRSINEMAYENDIRNFK